MYQLSLTKETKMTKLLLSLLAATALAGCAQMKAEEDKIMGIEVKAPLKACPTKVAIGDVPSCGKVWKLASGSAELKKDGALTAEVKGLVLDDTSTGSFNGTPDGVDGVAAAVVCGGKVAAQSVVVPLSKTGDATVNVKVSVPTTCTTPVIVLRERYEGKIGGWLAATGTW
jgi:hypothetical protein